MYFRLKAKGRLTEVWATYKKSPWFIWDIGIARTIIGVAFTVTEALHGKRDTFERDLIIGGLLSFSPIVIYVVWIYKSASPKDYFSHANTILEAFHGKRDTLECDIIIGGSLSFSPIVIFVVWIY